MTAPALTTVAMPAAAPRPALGWIGGALRVWRRNLESWRKYWKASLVGALGEPILSLLAIGYGLGRFVDIEGVPYPVFLAPALVATASMNAASFESTFGSFTRMHEQRTYDGILATPIGVREIVAGDALWAASKAGVAGTAVLLVASAAGLIRSPLALLLPAVAVLIGLVFATMGLVVTSRAQGYDFFTYYFTLVITVMYLFAGVFFPLGSLPGWAQAIAWLLPLTHAVALVRALVAGDVGLAALAHLAALLLVIGVAYELAVRRIAGRLIG